MPADSASSASAQLLACLNALQALRPADLPPAEATARRELRQWQAARLARTHAALLAHPRHAPAARFFLDELYGPHDHHQRDRDLARIVPKLVKVLPERAVMTLVEALRLDVLSESLDQAMVASLRQRGHVDGEGGLHEVSDAAYAKAYRAVCREPARVAERRRQIELVGEIGRSLDRVTRLPLIAAALRLMRAPAEKAGLADLHRFLHGGFEAFRALKGADEFLRCISEGETAVMDRLLAEPPVLDFSAAYTVRNDV